MTKLKYIADKLGISASTVSRAINEKTSHMVKESTRKKILDLIKQEGFKPNVRARALKKSEINNFTMIMPAGIRSIFYDEYYNRIMKGLLDELKGTEYYVSLLPVDPTFSPDEVFNLLLNHETAGLILSPYCKYIDFPYDILKKYDFPIICIDNKVQGANIYNIVLDHVGAGYLGGSEILKNTVKDLILISNTDHSDHSEWRKKGFIKYIQENKIEKKVKVHYLENKFSFIGVEEIVNKILKIGKRNCSIFSLNDEVAIGILNEFANRNIKVPDDIKVLGFDGIYVDTYTNPQLTSIAFPFEEIGQITADILINVYRGNKVKKNHYIKASVREGKSC